ncbi:MAG: ice-binding family protein [Candidatus Humimicrobiaceae bacterium]
MKKSLKALYRMRYLPLLLVPLLVTMMVLPGTLIAGPTTVNLGTAASFAVLAGTGITNTGNSVINGDIGSYPTASITGFPPGIVNGTNHAGDAVTQGAKDDLVIAYNDAAGRTPTSATDYTGVDLGGLTLTSGVYRASTSMALTGTLTLDAQGDPNAVFIFQAGSTLTTASSSAVSLINGARFCRVFWQVGSSATLGTSTSFVGHIFALTSITATTGATVQGQLLARNGAVTLDTNTITNGLCAEITPGISLTKTPSPTSIFRGDKTTVTYTYTVTNLDSHVSFLS